MSELIECDFCFLHPSAQVVVVCVMTQMNYLNKALDLFNTAIVSPVYYVMFTLLTILASIIMFRVRGLLIISFNIQCWGIVSPVYYVVFTLLTILASIIMFIVRPAGTVTDEVSNECVNLDFC